LGELVRAISCKDKQEGFGVSKGFMGRWPSNVGKGVGETG
jgi:hypothetical protein